MSLNSVPLQRTNCSPFAQSLLQYHHYLQNILKHQIEIYVPSVPQGRVKPLDNYTQMRCHRQRDYL